MTWLIFSILCSTIIFVIFKYFDHFKVDNLQAIVVNYIIAYSVGMGSIGFSHHPISVINFNWFPNVIVLSFMFISIFQVMAFVSQKIGVSVVSVASKMSLIMPVTFGILYHNDSFGWIKGVGIFIALIAVYLTTKKQGKLKTKPSYTWLPILLFISSGFLDIFLKYNQEVVVPEEEHVLFTSSIFSGAAILGIILVVIQLIRKKTKLEWKNLWAGIILGIPNYGSIYFLIKALHGAGESSVIFPVNNVAIVSLSVITGLILFKEKLSRYNIIGILLAVLAILLIGFENFS